MRNWLIGMAALASGAQAEAPTPKAYVVGEIHVTDPVAFKAYAGATLPILARYGGHYIARGGKTEPIEGYQPADRVVLIEFPSLAAAEAYENSAEYRAIAPIRQKSSTGHLFIVEGVAP